MVTAAPSPRPTCRAERGHGFRPDDDLARCEAFNHSAGDPYASEFVVAGQVGSGFVHGNFLLILDALGLIDAPSALDSVAVYVSRTERARPRSSPAAFCHCRWTKDTEGEQAAMLAND